MEPTTLATPVTATATDFLPLQGTDYVEFYVGNAKQAADLQLKLLPLHKAMFVEANPIPVKWAMARMGRIKSGIRLPLVPLAKSYESTVESALKNLGVIT